MSATIRSMSECRLVLCMEEERQEMYGVMIKKEASSRWRCVYKYRDVLCTYVCYAVF
jgi:hypothetical protein